MDFWWRRRRFDVIVTSHILPVGTAAMMFRLLTGKPYDVILHGLDFDGAMSQFRKRVAAWLVLHFARRIFTNSHALAREVEAFSYRSCLVLYPCVSDELVEAADMVRREESAERQIKLLTVGRLVDRKGHIKVLQAMKDLPNVTYTVVGDGPLRNEIQRRSEDLGLTDRVTVLQHVSDGKLPELYATHDIFVMPTTKSSSDREGFGIVYIEASLFGLPTIATRQPGVDEAVIDRETGFLIEDDGESLMDALTSLSSDPSLRRSLGTNGRKRVLQNFTRQKTMRAFGDISVPPGEGEAGGLVSVVIPTYQHAKSIGRCIESVLAQTYPRIEVIVVDDGSTDETAEVLKFFTGRVRVLSQSNQGANPARNRGLAQAKGEFVIITDADVVMKPAMIDEFVAALKKHPKASYAYSSFRFGWKRFRGIPFDADRLRRLNFIHTTSLVRRADFPGFDDGMKRFQDWDVWLSMLEKGKVGVLVSGTWFRVLIDGTSRIGSSWLPSFVYKLPWKYFGWMPQRVRKYQSAREVIEQKHHV